MEAFAMFCGIGIHNTKTYESTCKLMAKQVSDSVLDRQADPSPREYWGIFSKNNVNQDVA